MTDTIERGPGGGERFGGHGGTVRHGGHLHQDPGDAHLRFVVAEQKGVGRLVGEHARRRLIGVVLVVVVLLAGGGATWLATAALSSGQRQLAEQSMTRTGDDAAEAVDDEMSHYADAIADVASGIGATDDLTATDWAGMTSTLTADRLPGATSVAWVVPAKDPAVAATQAEWRARGAKGLTLYRTGTGVEHQFVIYMKSFTRLPPAPGRDLSSTPATREALDLARRSSTLAVGGAHISLRDRQLPVSEQQLTVTMAVPVLDRKGQFGGWVVMGVHGVDFLRSALAGRLGNAVNLQLVDSEPTVDRTLVRIAGGVPMNEPTLNRSRSIDVGQRTWRVDLQPTTALLGVSDRRLSSWTPVAGGAFSLLLAVLIGVLVSGRIRATDRADRATAALRQDIERRQAVEAELRERELSQLRELAFHDQLTGLANRVLFFDRVIHALRTHARDNDTFAVFFIDLDGFKEVNDQLGHGAGDAVLRATADRLKECMRESDTTARFGGDEFAMLLERLADPADVLLTADRMVAALREPIRIGSRMVSVTASIGIALNRPGDDADAILRAADLAMYEAKTSGKSRHVLSGS
ncbi:sensor domain-containing diguanylate cyclase [Actinoplanes sp. NPDC089786]|uniref:sensor domain-containing diguanylate cyclase n=1 Tax=Actinoplanes sp. NPDC089786 TaxID=3155185 RepID=UPI00343DE1DB